MMFGSNKPAGQLADTRKEFLMLLRQMVAFDALRMLSLSPLRSA
jgi:hypothetical protein